MLTFDKIAYLSLLFKLNLSEQSSNIVTKDQMFYYFHN